MQLETLQLETRLQMCIRMGINIIQFSFGEVNCRIYCQISHYTALLLRCRKTKFPTVNPQMKILNTVIPKFVPKKMTVLLSTFHLTVLKLN